MFLHICQLRVSHRHTNVSSRKRWLRWIQHFDFWFDSLREKRLSNPELSVLSLDCDTKSFLRLHSESLHPHMWKTWKSTGPSEERKEHIIDSEKKGEQHLNKCRPNLPQAAFMIQQWERDLWKTVTSGSAVRQSHAWIKRRKRPVSGEPQAHWSHAAGQYSTRHQQVEAPKMKCGSEVKEHTSLWI